MKANKLANLHGPTLNLNNNNELMLHKQSIEEKIWYRFHINPLCVSVALTLKPVNRFAVQINWLVSI